jgi:ferredoxin
MAKIKVWIYRDQCIADMVCVSLCPDVFEMNEEDGKSQIVEQYRVEHSEEKSVGIVPEDLEDCVASAAESCPTGIIHYEKIEE